MHSESRMNTHVKKEVVYRLSFYYNRFLSYSINLIFIFSAITIIATYFFHLKYILYLFPFYYLYTQNSLQKLIINHTGLVYFELYIIVSFIYFSIESLSGLSIGNIIMELRGAKIKDNNNV